MDYIKLNKIFKNYLLHNLSKKRYFHSIKVAEMSNLIARKFKINVKKAYFAGLVHDIARELEIEKQREIIQNFDEFSLEFNCLPILFHGPVGAYILLNEYEINDKEILDSVKYHTIGNDHMGDLAKIVYVADYISMDRTHIDNDFRDLILTKNIDQMVLLVTCKNREYFISKGEHLLPETEKMYNNIVRKISEEEKRI